METLHLKKKKKKVSYLDLGKNYLLKDSIIENNNFY